jgi:hypothetical protein
MIQRSVDKFASPKSFEERITVLNGLTDVKKGDVVASLDLIESGIVIGQCKLISDSEARATGNVFGPMGWFGGSICLVLVAWQRGRRISRRTSPKSIGSSRR